MEKLKNKMVLVTGGAGFIGSHLVRALVNQRANVCVVVHPQEKIWRLNCLVKKINIFKTDIEHQRELSKIVKKIQPLKIYHLAAITNRENTLKNARLVVKKNILGTISLIVALNNIHYDCFINIGTSDEYAGNPIPFKEDQSPNPISFYAASKTANWFFCNIFHNKLKLPIVNLRLFLVYGPKQNTSFFIPQLIISALKGQNFKMTAGEQTRDFIYVEDIVDGIIKASLIKEAIGQTINFCSGKEYMLRDIAKMINDLTGRKIKILYGSIPYRDNEIGRIVGDNSKAKKILGWKPKISLKEGLEKTIMWYRKDDIGHFNEEFLL